VEAPQSRHSDRRNPHLQRPALHKRRSVRHPAKVELRDPKWHSGPQGQGITDTVTGKTNAWSILLAEPIHNSWVYITAPGTNDKELMVANSLIQFEKNATGGLVCFRGDMATRANKVVTEHPTRTWTMNYGYMNTLRAHLVAV
jgi:hypothetical protein